jgi:hypothetical protein
VRIRKSELYEFILDRENFPPNIFPPNEDAVGDNNTFTIKYDNSLTNEKFGCDDSGRDKG